MMDMAKAINASTPQDFRANVSPFMDIDYFVNYIVADRAIHNSDGIMTWYVINGGQGNHNFYFYRRRIKGGKPGLYHGISINAPSGRYGYDDFDVQTE
jgi:spore coat protein CotH